MHHVTAASFNYIFFLFIFLYWCYIFPTDYILTPQFVDVKYHQVLTCVLNVAIKFCELATRAQTPFRFFKMCNVRIDTANGLTNRGQTSHLVLQENPSLPQTCRTGRQWTQRQSTRFLQKKKKKRGSFKIKPWHCHKVSLRGGRTASDLCTRTFFGGVSVSVLDDPLDERDNVMHVLSDS